MSVPGTISPRQIASDIRSAWMLFLILPCPLRAGGGGNDDAGDAGEARNGGLWAYPLIGLAIGLMAGFVFLITTQFALPPLAAAGLTLALLAAITGAMHEDGLADFADGLGGRSPGQRLAIMRDHAIGAYGASALIMVTLLRFAALASLAAPGPAIAALAGAGVLSRGILPGIVYVLAPARADGLGRSVEDPSGNQVAVALGLSALLAFILLPAGTALLCLGAALGVAALFAWAGERLLGGYTGDMLGAAQQICEAALLLVLAAML